MNKTFFCMTCHTEKPIQELGQRTASGKPVCKSCGADIERLKKRSYRRDRSKDYQSGRSADFLSRRDVFDGDD